VKCQALDFLAGQTANILSRNSPDNSQADVFVSNTKEYIGIGPFFIKKVMRDEVEDETNSFNLEAPTTSQVKLRRNLDSAYARMEE